VRWAAFFLLLAAAAFAAEVQVEEAETLFLTGDGGTVVLEGNPVVLIYDGRRIEAARVVYDREAKVLRLSGRVRYTDAEGRQIEAESLVLRLEDEALIAVELRLKDKGLEFRAPSACKNQGQIKLVESYFSPCLPCGQDPPDYAFFAKKVVIYPGDRVVAWDVWVEIEGRREFYLPLLVLYTGPRRPRLALGVSEADGLTLEADLPYVTPSGLGFTLLRYFERRGLGFGVDHWEVGPEKAHLYALYLPPPVGEDEGSIRLLAEWADTQEGWKQSFTLRRDDDRVPGRFEITGRVEKTTKEDPQVVFRLERTLDTEPDAPALRGIERLELELAWKRGLRERGFSLNGKAVLGAYEAETNRQNRSAWAQGPRIQAGRALIEHHERYTPRLSSGFFLSGSNDFTGYYYSTAEIQIDWKSALKAGYRTKTFESGLKLTREVREGETPFAFDRVPTRRKAALVPYLRYRPRPFTFSLEGGYEFFSESLLPLKARAELREKNLRFSLDYSRNLEENRPEAIRASLSFAPRPFSLRANVGYRWSEDRYDPLTLRASYALPGGSASLSTRYDPGEGRFQSTRAALALRQGAQSLALQASYDHLREALALSASLGQGPWKLGARIRYPRPDGVPDADDALEGHLSGTLSLAYQSNRLELTGELYDRAAEWATLAFYSSGNRLKGRWDLAAKLHLPDREDPALYLADFSLRGALELSPAFAVQGTLAYRNTGEEELLLFQNFGLTFRLYQDPTTRVFLSTFLTQTFDLGGETPTPVQPRIILTYDRCCWALRFSMDTEKEEISLSLLYGGQSLGLSMNPEGVLLPGGVRVP